MTNSIPLVSVCMMTYNHEKFISKALDSILMQKVNFKYEIVLGDDFSTDNTRKIITEYEHKNKGIFNLLFHTKNIGAHLNQISTMHACQGKYIAMLEGDDYWTDPGKLQKQVDFLEGNEDYVICTHGTECVNENSERYGVWFSPPELKDFYTLKDFISYGRTFIATSSILTRNYTKQIHEWFHNSPAGDMALIMSMCLQENGKIKRFNEFMSVHRDHKGGIYSGLSYLEKQIFSIETRIYLRNSLPKEYEPSFKKGLRFNPFRNYPKY